MKKDQVVGIAKKLNANMKKPELDISASTKRSQGLTIKWQKKCMKKNATLKDEFPVGEYLKEKFDLFDRSTRTVYELKVSGKNPRHEFYKDVFKVLAFNSFKKNEVKVSTLVFITEKKAAQKLKKEKTLDSFVSGFCKKHKLCIEIESI